MRASPLLDLDPFYALPTPSARSIEVRLLALPRHRTLGAAHDPAAAPVRSLTVVRIEADDGTIGWGECSALDRPTYTPEWAEGAYATLVAWADGAGIDRSREPMAGAAVEMATLDVALRQAGRSLAEQIGARRAAVRAGATVALAPIVEGSPDVEASLRIARELVAEGYRRLKIKIDPTQIDDVPHALSHALTDTIEIQVDANGSLDDRHFMELLGLARHGVAVIEQPFATDRLDLAAEFAAVADTIVAADEGARSIGDLEAALAAGAIRAAVIKPGCVGGIGPAIEMLHWCRKRGLEASVGGMLESALGRHALTALAATEGFTITGDVSPAGQWLAADPWPDVALRLDEHGAALVDVHDGVGVAPDPDDDAIDHFTQRVHRRTL